MRFDLKSKKVTSKCNKHQNLISKEFNLYFQTYYHQRYSDIPQKRYSAIAVRLDKIHVKLMKIVTSHLTSPWSPLAKATNTSINQYTFPESAKVVPVVPHDKSKFGKNVILNFRPVNIFLYFL